MLTETKKINTSSTKDDLSEYIISSEDDAPKNANIGEINEMLGGSQAASETSIEDLTQEDDDSIFLETEGRSEKEEMVASSSISNKKNDAAPDTILLGNSLDNTEEATTLSEDFFAEPKVGDRKIALSTEELGQVLEDAVEDPNAVEVPIPDGPQSEFNTQEQIVSDEFFQEPIPEETSLDASLKDIPTESMPELNLDDPAPPLEADGPVKDRPDILEETLPAENPQHVKTEALVEEVLESLEAESGGSSVKEEPAESRPAVQQNEDFFKEDTEGNGEIALSTEELGQVLEDAVEDPNAVEVPIPDGPQSEFNTQEQIVSDEFFQEPIPKETSLDASLKDIPTESMPELNLDDPAPPLEADSPVKDRPDILEETLPAENPQHVKTEALVEEVLESLEAESGGSSVKEEPVESRPAVQQNEDFFKEDTEGNGEIALSTEELGQVLEDAVEDPNAFEAPTPDGSQSEFNTQEQIVSDEFFQEPIPEETSLDASLKDIPTESMPELNLDDPAPPLEADGRKTKEPATDSSVEDVSKIEREDIRKVISYLDTLLGELPDHVIKDFAKSEHFSLYKKVMDQLGV